MEQKRTLILTGSGKGKTTSAFGMALRTLGHGGKVAVIQFIKHDGGYGEVKALRTFSKAEVHCCGLGFTPKYEDSPQWERHEKAAQEGWVLAQKFMQDESVNLVILDEVFYPIQYGFIHEDEVISALSSSRGNVILTGRNASEKMKQYADTVSVIESPSHGYQRGILAQEGFEF